jgi:hypothetical protein
MHHVHVRAHTLPASTFCISKFRCTCSYYCVSHTVHVRTWLRPDHVRTAARLESVSFTLVLSFLLSRTKFTCEWGWMFRSDHVRPVAHLPRCYYNPLFSFRCYNSIFIINWFVRSSRANGVDILLIYTYSTKFTCERGWAFIYLVSGRYFCRRGDVLGYVSF